MGVKTIQYVRFVAFEATKFSTALSVLVIRNSTFLKTCLGTEKLK